MCVSELLWARSPALSRSHHFVAFRPSLSNEQSRSNNTKAISLVSCVNERWLFSCDDSFGRKVFDKLAKTFLKGSDGGVQMF